MTHRAYHALDSHIVGSTLWSAGVSAVMKTKPDFVQTFIRELPVAEYPFFAEHVQQHMTKSVPSTGKSEFEFGLDLILDGLEKILTGKPVRRSRATPNKRSRARRKQALRS